MDEFYHVEWFRDSYSLINCHAGICDLKKVAMLLILEVGAQDACPWFVKAIFLVLGSLPSSIQLIPDHF